VQACLINQSNSLPARKLSKQVFHLFPKLREVDSLLTPELQSRVYEAHPELAFCVMNGGKALSHSKKTPDGEAERREMLRQQGLPEIPEEAFRYPRRDVARDDVFDACAAAWTARRILNSAARHFPEGEERDARGLLMRIHA
jgi:predicted RNase H-like nuclease